MPVDKAFEMIREKLEKNDTQKDRTTFTPQDIIIFLHQCLKCTYFFFQGNITFIFMVELLVPLSRQ